jgi:thiol-disulfide isomerase/thioredoxin
MEVQQVGIADVIYNLFASQKEEKANRLLVITEPGWCAPCRKLDPVLKQLKKEGYDVYEYTQGQWYKAKPKPAGVPKIVQSEGQRPRVPTLLFVKADAKTNKVVRWKRGWSNKDDEQSIKRYLTK